MGLASHTTTRIYKFSKDELMKKLHLEGNIDDIILNMSVHGVITIKTKELYYEKR